MTGTWLVLGAAAAIAGLAYWYQFWISQSRLLKQSGYIPPATSWFAKLFFNFSAVLMNFLTVGPVKVIGRENSPKKGPVIYVANHQVPSDFAMVRRASGRHYRALGSAEQFPGFFGALAAWIGVFCVTYKTREERQAGEAACIKVACACANAMAISCKTATLLTVILAASSLVFVWDGNGLAALASLVLICMVGASKGGDPALAVAPQGALLPDNELRKDEFRPGVVRVARAVQERTGQAVKIVPMAIHYKRDAKDAHWTHRFLKKTRSMFLGMRNPRYWDPLFKIDAAALPAAERSELERQRAAKLEAYKHSHITSYGGVVVVGEPFDVYSLPADPLDAIEEIRLKIARLLEEAKKH